MRPTLSRFLIASSLTLTLACGERAEPTSPTQGGTASGGTSSGGAGDGAGSGGDVATGGASTGGGPASGGGSSGGAVGSGGASSVPVPSAGCGKPIPTTGERQMEVAGHTGLYIVSVPTNYDPDTPYPLGFAFHGRNRNHQNCQAGDCAGFQNVMGDHAVLVYMQSLRTPNTDTQGGWEADGEREGNVEFFEAVRELVQSELCVDETQVFVAGTSSGAHFANVLACRFGDELLAVAPVAGYLPESTDCQGTPAALVVHGIDDPHVPLSNGETARDFFVGRNGCANTTEPALADMHQDIRTKRDATPTVEDHGCVDYQGCAAGPVRWCEHSYGGYDDSTHGWPPNGGQLIWDFVEQLR